ncbi:TPA: GatB/YqeY domain-containing protein [Candidatus Ventrenecus avicola]|nr:GatB/YqeY domain-containing protein [Candidatus Ventrenecus avicola]
MSLNERIANDMKAAMKSQDKFSLSVLRMLKSALQLEGIQLKKELTDDEVMVVIKRNVKQRKDSMEEFQKFGKTDEVENLEKEIELLKKYLPEELSEEQIEEIINQVFDEIQPQSIKDMGRVMKELTSKIGTQADMSVVSSKVKARLQ